MSGVSDRIEGLGLARSQRWTARLPAAASIPEGLIARAVSCDWESIEVWALPSRVQTVISGSFGDAIATVAPSGEIATIGGGEKPPRADGSAVGAGKVATSLPGAVGSQRWTAYSTRGR